MPDGDCILRAHILQHVPYEGPGYIASWLKKADFKTTYTRFYESPDLPEPGRTDLLIVLGGPMSVNDEDKIPWIASEKRFIRTCIEKGVGVLGICLGAQLIASALGARVYRNRYKEIGWFPVHGLSPDDPSHFSFPPDFAVFHWHGETFDLPDGAVNLASSEACMNQAFQVGTSVMGLQFHLETTPDAAREIVAACKDELVRDAFVQTATGILSAEAGTYEAANRQMDRVLAFLTGASTFFKSNL
jgi:GMP synthase-like glutamine amidotransferase